MQSVTRTAPPVKHVYSGIGGPVIEDRDEIGVFARLATANEIAEAANLWIAEFGLPLSALLADYFDAIDQADTYRSVRESLHQF